MLQNAEIPDIVFRAMQVLSIPVTPVGFTQRETCALRAAMDLSRSKLKSPWRWSERAEGVILISFNSEEGRAQWSRYSGQWPAEQLVVCGNPAELPEAPWRLAMEPNRPPRFQDFVDVMNRVSESWLAALLRIVKPGSNARAAAEAKGATQPPAKPAFSPVFRPDEHFLSLARQTSGEKLPRVFRHGDAPKLWHSPSDGYFFCKGGIESLSALCRAPVRDIHVEEMIPPLFQAQITELALQSVAVKEIVWYAALEASQGRMWEGFRETQVVQLKQWPSVGRLPRYKEFLAAATFMHANAADLQTVAKETETPLALVIDFHNACQALDLLDRDIPPRIRKKEDDSGSTELYRKISMRLGGIRARDKSQNDRET
jgi:hypothetical protein